MAEKASVIFTTYNSPRALELVLWGFAAQTRRDFQVVVADDGSGIGLPSMLRRARETGGKLEAGPVDERTWHVRACWDAHTLASGSSEMAAGPTEPHRRAEEPAR